MPLTVSELLDAASLQLAGVVAWADPVPSSAPGVYVVSLSPDPDRNVRITQRAPIDGEAVKQWIRRVPTMTLDGSTRPTPEALAKRLSDFWLPDEGVIYIGQTCRPLKKRIQEYYRCGSRKFVLPDYVEDCLPDSHPPSL